MSCKLLTKFINRNPRNLEQLGLQARSSGYGMDLNSSRRAFIYRTHFERHRRHVVAQIVHYKDGPVLSASSNEKQLCAQLHSATDVSACRNVGLVLGLRCAMAGIHFVQEMDQNDVEKSVHKSAFQKGFVESGIELHELPHKEHTFSVDPNLTYDDYEVMHTREDNLD